MLWKRPLVTLLLLLASLTLTPPATAQSGYEQAVYDACARYGCSGAQLVGVMYCESGGDPSAVGPNGERGLFQYDPNGHNPGAAWVDPYTQIDIAAREWSQGLGYLWVCQG
jgi:hypothetical protein